MKTEPSAQPPVAAPSFTQLVRQLATAEYRNGFTDNTPHLSDKRYNEAAAKAAQAAAEVLAAHEAEVRAAVESKARLEAALTVATAYIRWNIFGECRTPGHDGPPPQPSNVIELIDAALQPSGESK